MYSRTLIDLTIRSSTSDHDFCPLLNPLRRPRNKRNATEPEFARSGDPLAPPGGARFKRDLWYLGDPSMISWKSNIPTSISDDRNNELSENAHSAWRNYRAINVLYNYLLTIFITISKYKIAHEIKIQS